MTERKFTGFIVNGTPVTVNDGMEAGIIRKPKTCPHCGSADVQFLVCRGCGKMVTEKVEGV